MGASSILALVSFDRREREVLLLVAKARDPKFIAGEIEIAVSTAYTKIRELCRRAKVLDRVELLVYVLQHPACLFAGVLSETGLHAQPCGCESAYCHGLALSLLQLAAETASLVQ